MLEMMRGLMMFSALPSETFNLKRRVLDSRRRSFRLNVRVQNTDSSSHVPKRQRKKKKFADSHVQVQLDLSTVVPDARVTMLYDEAVKRNGGVPKLTLRRGKATFLRRGNNLLFGTNIFKTDGKPKLGDMVQIEDGAKNLVGWGVFNPKSIYQVRMMQLIDEAEDYPECVLNMDELIDVRIREAFRLRNDLGLPSEDTNVYRLVNSDGDRLSGLVVDVLGDVVVVASNAGWIERYKDRVVEVLRNVLGVQTIVWRPSSKVLKQEGVVDAKEEILCDGGKLTFNDNVEVKEHGVKYNVFLSGQKTGFYVDQRDSRNFVRRFAKGKRVLDLCCYTGGFGVNAALGGAVEVKGIDSSASAIELASENARLNGVDATCSFAKADIVNFMQVCKENGTKWDFIILDPPKLAPNKASLDKAVIRYRKLNRAAVGILNPGGLLMTCTCSGAMTQSGRFLETIRESAEVFNRRVTVLRDAGPTFDHCTSPCHPESVYLTNLLVRIS